MFHILEGWHLVWTGVGKVFFFNPTSKLSIWERPKELENNVNVDEILSQGPDPSKVEEPSQFTVAEVDMEQEKTFAANGIFLIEEYIMKMKAKCA